MPRGFSGDQLFFLVTDSLDGNEESPIAVRYLAPGPLAPELHVEVIAC